MRLTVALVLSGAGLTVGLVCDLYGSRLRSRRPRMAQAGDMAMASTPMTPAAITPGRPFGGDDSWPARRAAADDRVPMVGGLDGCRRGWVLVVAPSDGAGPSLVQVVTDLDDVLAMVDGNELLAVGIDIPIGLPAAGPRRCDVAARRRIGRRGSSVFPAPPRALLGSHTYEEAATRCRAACGKSLTTQAFGILPKVEVVDGLMTPDRQYNVVEVHPEVSFTLLAGHPMGFRKARPEGRAERLEVLRRVFPDVDRHVDRPPSGARADDVLDAFAAAWSAARWLSGTYERFGGELDDRGLRMEIIA